MDEQKKQAIVDVLIRCAKGTVLSCKGCPIDVDLDCFAVVSKNALTLIVELSAEIEQLREMNDALANGFDTVKADIAQRMIDTARMRSFTAGDTQYISISELEEIVKGVIE